MTLLDLALMPCCDKVLSQTNDLISNSEKKNLHVHYKLLHVGNPPISSAVIHTPCNNLRRMSLDL